MGFETGDFNVVTILEQRGCIRSILGHLEHDISDQKQIEQETRYLIIKHLPRLSISYLCNIKVFIVVIASIVTTGIRLLIVTI